MLGPHDAEHRELEVVRVAPEPLADRVELVVRDAERAVERQRRRGGGRLGHGVSIRDQHQATTATGARFAAAAAPSTSERRIGSPSSEPSRASAARSGWGMSPATLPRALRTPAIARSEPFGLAGSPS